MNNEYDNWMIEVNKVIKHICKSSLLSYDESNSLITSILALGASIEDIKTIFDKQSIYGLVEYIECLELQD